MDGHESHHSIEFELYCKSHNILTLYMPSHSSHILQPLDVGCFAPLKQAYGRQIEDLMRCQITHVTKIEFLLALKQAFNTAINPTNIQGGFASAGLLPHNPQRVLEKAGYSSPGPPSPGPGSPGPTRLALWQTQTPHNAVEATCHARV